MSSCWKTDSRICLNADWSSLVFVRVLPDLTGNQDEDESRGHIPLGYVLVIEPRRRDPKYKLPGGHRKNGEPPLATALRELRGETGIIASPETFEYIGSEWRSHPSGHWSILFAVSVRQADIAWMNSGEPENEGEVPKFLTIAEFWEHVGCEEIMSPHLNRIVQAGLVLPLGRGQDRATA